MNLWAGLGVCVLFAVFLELLWCVASVLDKRGKA